MIRKLVFELSAIIDLPSYEYLAWKKLADEKGLILRAQDYDLIRSLSAEQIIRVILNMNDVQMTAEETEICLDSYESYKAAILSRLDYEDSRSGITDFLQEARKLGYELVMYSRDKMAEKLKIRNLFDLALNEMDLSGENSHVKMSEMLGCNLPECLSFQTTVSDIMSAHRAGMRAVGIYYPELQGQCDYFINDYLGRNVEVIVKKAAGQ